MNKKILITACILGVVAIVLGAFGAHGLKSLISSDAQQTFETGVRYQMYQALFLLCIGNLTLLTEKAKRIILYLTIFGVLCFSGSIYGLATNELTSFDFKHIGFITPIGGLSLIMAWVVLLINFFKKQD
ncbi:DUF423 domain-containing protein [Psychroserpens algicola]|uniref:DUF423 domain-containing protein n=1 Tax=Psychroserpens algicola TaxID=1719034 RepID=A0ABT0H4G0_9FLAO|nr:DUF423 domain-containing protein [Psychroserpens algicola]MCK8479267.1 DUF423 domain-containing protein [Psychroserpens algicola]